DLGDLLEVGAKQGGVAAFRSGRPCLGFRRRVVDRDARAFTRETQGDPTADALRSACHQNYPPLQGLHHTVGSPWTSTSSGSTPARVGSGSLPLRLPQAQKIAVVELRAPAHNPIVLGLTWSESSPAMAI